MAVIRDVMPAFELFQPASVDEALALARRATARRLGAGGRPGQLRLAQGPHQAPAVVVDLSAIAELKRHPA